jgi:hypothetical protein
MKKFSKMLAAILMSILMLASVSGLSVFAEEDAIVVSGFNGGKEGF